MGDVAQYLRGINFKPDDVVPVGTPGTVACMRTKNIQESLDCSDVWGVSEGFVRRPEQILKEGDILVSSANSWNLVGKCCWIPSLPWKSSFGGFVSALRADPAQLSPRFLYWWFSSDRTQALLRSFGQKTTNISNLSAERCMNLRVPLPALPEQRRIAAILDQADALRAKRREALAQLDSLTQSIFIEMFGDPVSNTKGWPDSTKLGQVAHIVSGVTKGRNLTGKTTRTVPYLAVANVQDKSLSLSAVKVIEATEDEISRYRLELDDLLLTEGGDPDKLGRGTLWKNELPECIHQNHIFRVRLTSDKLTPLFLNWLVGSQRGKKFFLRSAKQTTGIASINMTQLRSFPLLLPPIELQRRFTQHAAALAEQQSSHVASLAALDALFASLQHRAFRGEL
ncbi:restriction endonuclease subunit S [Acidovorax sp. SD340]|nr:restriction endonuclease [Acidovorax sp. SD340]MBO1006327.1 restriction endonuclease subunit S [Acidovorax sp. SD340]